MNIRFSCILAGVATLAASAYAQVPPTADKYESTPFFTDDFNRGGVPAPQGRWIIDPDLAAVVTTTLQPAQFVGSTPSGLDASYATFQPVENNPSGDSAVMLVGNLSADAGVHFGLSYIDLADPDPTGSGTSYETLVNYRLVAKLFYLGTNQTAERFQAGVYAHAGVGQPDLFRAGPFHNTSATGGGPGFGVRGVVGGTQAIPSTVPIADARWTLVSVMVLDDSVAICVDANGDDILDESDPLEYQSYDRDPADNAYGYPAVWTVGVISSDVFPLFVDDVELYSKLVPAAAENWTLYN